MKKIIFLLTPALFVLLACSKNSGTENGGNGAPQITTLVMYGDTLHIIGHFGPAPTVAERRVIINEETVPEEKIVKWDEDEIEVKVEKKTPDEKKVQVEIEKKKSNVKIINIPSVPVTQLLQLDFLQVEEFSSFLYIHGNFGADPGAARRSIRMWQFTNREVFTKITNIISWTPNLIICQIPSEGEGSCGKVIVKVDQDSASRYLYTYEGILDHKRPQGGANGSLAEKIQFHIRLRGDGEPAAASVPVKDLKTNLHVTSYAEWEGSGQGSSSYNNIDGCATIRVVWDKATGKSFARNNVQPNDTRKWAAWVTHRRNGFDIKIKFQADRIIKSKVTTTDCKGNTNAEDREEAISFDDFDEKVIPLRFAHGTILSGEVKKENVVSSAGLAWDVKEFPLHFMTAYVKWEDISGWLEEL
jgi:hypothetical protein